MGTGNFGEGTPKVCVPIVAECREEIWKRAERIAELPVDLAEWRVDFYEKVSDFDEVLTTLKGLKARLNEKALLFTFRTVREGGNPAAGLDIEKDGESYYSLNLQAVCSGNADLIDVEAFLAEGRTAEIIREIHDRSAAHVILSNHEFHKTPPVEEMVRRLRCMEEMGADAAKLAVMPGNRQDVLNLLQATVTADEALAVPVVTMSMGALGMVSRICGNLTGSAMTFATAGEASAPGQIPVEQMAAWMKLGGV